MKYEYIFMALSKKVSFKPLSQVTTIHFYFFAML